jgi:anti-sigma factor RsiW
LNCEDVSALLPELLGGNLKREQEAEALRHLAGCAHCREELAFWAKLSASMKAEADEMPVTLFGDVGERLGIRKQLTVQESIHILKSTFNLTNSVLRMALSVAGTTNR